MQKVLHIILFVAIGVLMVACNNHDAYFQSSAMENAYSSLDNNVITEQVDAIEIDWVAGEINIVPTDDSVITVSETSSKPLTDTTALRFQVSRSGKLCIQFCKSGIELNGDQLNDLRKVLTVKVPSNLHLDDIEIDGVGGKVLIDSVLCREISIDGVNFNTTAHFDRLPEEIECDGLSQELHLFVPAGAAVYAEADGLSAKVSNQFQCDKSKAQCKVSADGLNVKVVVRENK